MIFAKKKSFGVIIVEKRWEKIEESDGSYFLNAETTFNKQTNRM